MANARNNYQLITKGKPELIMQIQDIFALEDEGRLYNW